MLKRPNKRIILLISLLIIIGFLGFMSLKSNHIKTVQARAGDPDQPQLFGWAWTSTIGWISMNCYSETGDYCDADHDYGVSVDETTGKLKGYAWSSNLGWINFSDTSKGSIVYPDQGTANDPTSNCDKTNCADGRCSACYNFSTHHLYGWAHIVSFGNAVDGDGWIRLDNPSGTNDWGVVESNDPDNADFYGWAWNGNDTPKTGIGWISFNSETDPDSTIAYKVDGYPRNIEIVSIERTKGEESHSLTITWNGNVYGETKFYILRTPNDTREGDDDASDEELVRYIDFDLETEGLDNLEVMMNKNSTIYADGSYYPKNRLKKELDMGDTYTYRIKACNMFGCSYSENLSKKTSPIAAVVEFVINTTCDDNGASFVMQWRRPLSKDGLPIDYYEGQYCVVTAGQTIDDCEEADWVAGDTFYYDNFADVEPFSIQTYTDQMSETRFDNYRYNNHFYRIRAVNDHDGSGPPTDDDCEEDKPCDDIGSWAYTERAVRPCVPPTQPKYQEVRPR
ncbi:MAG: hypothetical protein V1865_00730 [bacterium]